MSTIQQETRSVRDMLIAAKVISKDSRAEESACLTCRIPVWVSFFFDGTGNNAENDKAPHCQSNVVALYETHKRDIKGGIQKFYYEGLGTSFKFEQFSKVKAPPPPTDKHYHPIKKGDDTDPENRTFGYSEKDSQTNTVFGRGFAKGVRQRLQKAIFDLVKYLDIIYQQRGMTEVNICAYGFSRGATTARIFMNWVEQAPNVTSNGSQLFYRGKPLYLKILGIFDTVESIGWAAANKNPQAYKTSVPKVEHIVHLTASLEMRKSFPLTPSRKDNYRNDVKSIMTHDQQVYPGAHSNVGGGYRPMEQLRNLGLSRITLHTMYNRLCALGGKFYTLNELSQNEPATYEEFFKFDPVWRKDLDAFMVHAPLTNKLHEDLEKQIYLYHRWIRNGGYARFIVKNLKSITKPEKPKDKKNPSQAEILDAVNYKYFKDVEHMLNGYLPKGSRPKDVLNRTANQEDLPPEVIHWFENYVADSMGGFVGIASDVTCLLQDTKHPDYLIPRGIETPT